MTNIKPLIDLSDLKTSIILDKDLTKKMDCFQINYDDELDFLDVKFVNISTTTIVHYIDDVFGILFDPSTKEIVGFHFEGFKKNVVNKNPEIAKSWYTDRPYPAGTSILDLQNDFYSRASDLSNQLFSFSKRRMKVLA